jgi:hypothetical protein
LKPIRVIPITLFYLLAGLVTVKVYHNWKQRQEATSAAVALP